MIIVSEGDIDVWKLKLSSATYPLIITTRILSSVI